MSVHKYSVTPESNTSVGDGSDTVGLQEGMPRQNVNNAMRAIASDIAKNYKDHGSLVTAGDGGEYTVFAQSDFTAYFVGMSLVVKLHADCEAGATINVNSRGAKALRMRGPNGVSNVEANALRANEVVHIVYNGTQFHVLGAFDSASVDARIDDLEAKYTTTGTVVFQGSGQFNGGAIYSQATSTGSARFFMLDDTSTTRGLLRWERGNDRVQLRRYDSAGVVEGEFVLEADDVKFNGNKIWHEGNDGPGSGLDADTADNATNAEKLGGIDAADYARTDLGNEVFSGSGQFNGGAVYSQATATGNARFSMLDDTGTNRGLLYWDRGSDLLRLRRYNSSGAVEGELRVEGDDVKFNGNKIWHEGNDGPGSGLDADTLDGVELSALLRNDTAPGGLQSIALLRRDVGNSSVISPGMTQPGSVLAYANVAGQSPGTRPGGTWMCLGYVNTGSNNEQHTTLWQRIA